ncbi:MAG: putative GNAT superfamily acetyltransferase [Gammaproteobacteria bacterium]|jgi:predicted GNAT superfamily acetyltransferase
MNNAILIRDYRSSDLPDILSLNEASVELLSPMDEPRFQYMAEQATIIWTAEVNNKVGGFMMIFNSSAHYDSPNFLWFNEHCTDFLYIDRIVINSASRGLGLGQKFYRKLSDYAVHSGYQRLVCEVDSDPPNQPSLHFHQQQGFLEIAEFGPGSGKMVSLQEKVL